MSETLLQGAGGYAAVPEHHGGVTIAEVLQSAGVGTLFCLPGGHLGAVTDGCGKAGIRIVGTRHESAAVHMAEAWARCTGETGVAGITAGPGFTNCITGVAHAHAGRGPDRGLRRGEPPRRWGGGGGQGRAAAS